MTVGIRYIDGPRFTRSLLAAADWVAAGREEINRINVFPVPDGDTGTNFTLTLRSVADRSGRWAMPGGHGEDRGTWRDPRARGNSGMMLAHFLLGFADEMEGRETATAQEIAAGLRRGVTQLYASLDDPREGTILTVAREATDAAERAATDSPDISVFMTRLLREGEPRAHRELMRSSARPVVDAGGTGVRMLEGGPASR
jgi:dihydroxyacetone kinase-like predicted kinase